MAKGKILVVEDDEVTNLLISKMLENHEFEVMSARSVPEALLCLSRNPVDVVLSDIEMSPIRGVELLKRIPSDLPCPKPLVVFMTSKGSLSSACETLAQGAFDYIGKPVDIDSLLRVLERALRQQRDVEKGHVKSIAHPDFGLIGSSPKMVELYKNVARAAFSDSNVFIWGESGTGKELIARAIHENSVRKENRFVTVNCGALTETLLESELFGHLKGSFTGAVCNKKGLFEEANGGTLFLDEIGDISPGLQVKLLRVIQEGEFKPVGSVENRRVNVRVIAATHRNLAKMVQEEKFREDLFYRLKVLTLQLPALRERKEDILPLTYYFLNLRAGTERKISLAESTVQLLLNYSWPGNIRELEHAVERAVAMTRGTVLYPQDFLLGNQEPESSEEPVPAPLVSTPIFENSFLEEPLLSIEELEKQHILKVIKRTHFNKTRAAQILGIDRATLYRKAERYQISLGEKEEPFSETIAH